LIDGDFETSATYLLKPYATNITGSHTATYWFSGRHVTLLVLNLANMYLCVISIFACCHLFVPRTVTLWYVSPRSTVVICQLCVCCRLLWSLACCCTMA